MKIFTKYIKHHRVLSERFEVRAIINKAALAEKT
jgi:hypothetical protein